MYDLAMAKTKERWDFRVAVTTDELVRQAAELTDRTLTEFVVGAAAVEAEHVLADRTRFELAPEQWERFTAALDRPPRGNPALKRLLSTQTVFSSE